MVRKPDGTTKDARHMKRISLLTIVMYWTTIAYGQWNALPEFTNARLHQVIFCDETCGWVLGDHFSETSFCVFRTMDGGYTWDSTQFKKRVEKIFLLDRDHGFALTSTLMHTNDGGKHWYSRYIPGEARDIFFVSPDTGWVSTDFGLFKTLDAGDNWIPLSGFTGNPLNLWFIDSRHGYVVNQWPTGYVLGRTTDGGTTWGYNTIPMTSWFRIFGSGVGYLLNYYEHPTLGVESYLLKTHDNGFNWDTLDLPVSNVFDPGTPLNCFFLNENTGWVTLLSGIYRTDDGGMNWTFQSIALPKDISFADTDFGWSVGFPDHGAMHTINGGGGSIGIADNEEYSLCLKVWPNPCNDYLRLEYELETADMIQLRLMDASGRDIATLSYASEGAGHHLHEMSLPHLLPGIYLLQIATSTGNTHRKILKN